MADNIVQIVIAAKDQASRVVTDAMSTMERATKSLDASLSSQKGFQTAASDAALMSAELKRQAADAQRVWAATRTPAEAYRNEIAHLHTLLKSGVIDQQTYGRAVGQAKDSFNAKRQAKAPTRSLIET